MPERVSGKHNGKDILPGGNDKSARQLESSMRVQASGEKIYNVLNWPSIRFKNGKSSQRENGRRPNACRIFSCRLSFGWQAGGCIVHVTGAHPMYLYLVEG